MTENELLVHYWQLPEDLFISLKDEFHTKLCNEVQILTNHHKKNCFYKLLDCPKYHAQRLFNKDIRFTISEVNILSEKINLSKQEIENNIETIGNHEDGTIIKNPILPFRLNDLIYVASHLMFDGSYRYKRGCYLLCYGEGLLEYHKERLKIFGEVPTNYIEKEHQLYFSYTISYICSKELEISDFRSMKVFLSAKFKTLCRNNKFLLDEFVKAMIIDEASIDDQIRIELGNNEKFIRDIHELVSLYYNLSRIYFRERIVGFEENTKWVHNLKSWKIDFKNENFNNLYKSITPLPIKYKQEKLNHIYYRKNRIWYKRNKNETKKLILKYLIDGPKSISELSILTGIRGSNIIFHINSHPSYSKSLKELGIVSKIGEIKISKGSLARINIYGVINEEKAKEYIKNI